MWIRVCIDDYWHSELVILEYIDHNYAPRGAGAHPLPPFHLVHFFNLLLYLFLLFPFYGRPV